MTNNQPLTFDDFQALNRLRCETGFKHAVCPPGADWPVQNWALAICGESGEAANLMKKVLRGDFPLEHARPKLLEEYADVITYSDLMISALGSKTSKTLMDKFKLISERIGWTQPVPVRAYEQAVAQREEIHLFDPFPNTVERYNQCRVCGLGMANGPHPGMLRK